MFNGFNAIVSLLVTWIKEVCCLKKTHLSDLMHFYKHLIMNIGLVLLDSISAVKVLSMLYRCSNV